MGYFNNLFWVVLFCMCCMMGLFCFRESVVYIMGIMILSLVLLFIPLFMIIENKY